MHTPFQTRGLRPLVLVSTLVAVLVTSRLPPDAAAAQSEKAKAQAKQRNTVPVIEQPRPVINYIFPAGGQRGQTCEVTVGGTNLASGAGFVSSMKSADDFAPQEAGAIRITGRGVTAHRVQATNLNTVRLAVTIAPDAEPGEREIRFVTRGGASNRYRFAVGDLPEVNEAEPNSEKNQAQRLESLPVLINGQILQGDRDYFSFTAQAGQTIVCEVQARALLPFIADAVPGWFDACLALYDAAGKKVDAVDDFRLRPDPVLIFKAPANGRYVLEISDVIYRGREDFIYRLALGPLPYITHLFPLGGQRGAETRVELHGANLPSEALEVALPNDASAIWPVTVSRDGRTSNKVFFAAGDWPEIQEIETNDSMAKANHVQPPVTVNGRIHRPGDSDCFVFTAKAGQRFVLEVQARRLGSPLDSLLAFFNSKGAELLANDDTVDAIEPLVTHHADSRLAYTFSSSGNYVLQVRDAQGKGGDEYAYRLVIAPPRPDFALRITPDNPRVGQGGTVMTTVSAVRKDGFNGEINLSVEGLPDGFVTSETFIPGNQNEASLTITAPLEAPLGVLSPAIVGTATVDSGTLVRQAIPAEAVMQAFSYTHNLPTKEFLLTVIEPGAFALSAATGPNEDVQIPQGSTNVQVIVKVSRKEGIRGAIGLALAKPPAGLTARNAFVPADKDEATVTLTATRQAPAGLRQNLIITGTLRSGRGNFTGVAPAIPIQIVAAPP